ncbi:MAG: hypothetical protein BWY71_01308 [Planctomycetes bacterium ADurb.Bin412]|nr:MAG: hypothetical protein BWY71_01308 [Planctomycetes bacterium ADurb.Bin412]
MDRNFKNRKMVLTGIFCIFLLVDFLVFWGASDIFWNLNTFGVVFYGHIISSVLVFLVSVWLYFFGIKCNCLLIGNLIFLLGVVSIIFLVIMTECFEYSSDSFWSQLEEFFVFIYGCCYVIYLPLSLMMLISLWKISSLKAYWSSRVALMWFVCFLLFIPALGIGTVVARDRVMREYALAKQQLQPIIEKLLAYHDRHQCYPDTLDAVVTEEELGKISKLFAENRYSVDEYGFTLRIDDPLFMGTYWYYDSGDTEWKRR